MLYIEQPRYGEVVKREFHHGNRTIEYNPVEKAAFATRLVSTYMTTQRYHYRYRRGDIDHLQLIYTFSNSKPECEQIYSLLSRIMVSRPGCRRPISGGHPVTEAIQSDIDELLIGLSIP